MSPPIDFLLTSIKNSNLKKVPLASSNSTKYPCGICSHEVKHNDKAILCSECLLWVHINCNDITTDEYKSLIQKNKLNPNLIEDEKWVCLNCNMSLMAEYFPFVYESSHDINNLNTSDSINLANMIPTFEIISEALKVNSLSSCDIDETNIINIDSKYYIWEEFKKIRNKPKSFNILHSNVNGFETHLEEIQIFLANSIEFSAICISETSLQGSDTFTEDIKLSTYMDPFYTNSKTSKGGVAIFINEDYNVIEREDLKSDNIEFEAVWIEIKIKKSKNIILGCTYRHPHNTNIDDFTTYMTTCLEILNKENKEIYISGDFNIDLLKYDTNKKYQEFYDQMTTSGVLPQILQPTRITESSSTIIDNIYTNNLSNDITSGNVLIQISDHLLQFSCINKVISTDKTPYYKRNYSKFNEQSFLDDLSIQNWHNQQDANTMFNDFAWRLESCINRHAPVKKLNKKELNFNLKPWITPNIIKKINHRNKLFLKRKKKPDDIDLKVIYNKFRNSVARDIKKSKKYYYSNYFEECKTNMKKTWRGIKELINTSNKNPMKVNELKVNNKLISDNLALANTFNNFFVNVGSEVNKSIPDTNVCPSTYLKNKVESNFLINKTSNAEVMTIILKLDDNKSSGPDDIPIKLLKIAAPIIVPRLVSIINTSFISGIFPDRLKLAKVIPIFKAGSKLDVNNYRPISLLSVFSKIIEKIMHSRLYSFFETNNVFYSSQFGFQKHKSTQHSLIEIVEKIRSCIESNKYGCGIFIDLKKAFDTVNHTILLQKLEHYGIRDTSLEWFSTYLKNRTQFVSCNNTSSCIKSISCGVPQGSVLGPLLFLIYINDLPNVSKKFNFYLFADDTNLFYQSDNLDELQKTVNKELKNIVVWLNANRLALNVSKTNFVIFSAVNKPLKPVTILINKKAIEEKEYVKYLGVLIDCKLSFKQHITAVSKKIARTIGLMYKLRHFVTQDILIMLYYSLIYPFLIYATPIWGNTNITLINMIYVLQKKFVRIITFNRTVYTYDGPPIHSIPLFKELKILTIFDLFKVEIIKFVYDSINNNNPNQFNDYFTYPINHYNTSRNRLNKLNVPQVRTTTYGLKSIKYSGALIWNDIPLLIRSTITSRKNMLYKVKILYLSEYGN